jgi:hypothetical protein
MYRPLHFVLKVSYHVLIKPWLFALAWNELVSLILLLLIQRENQA